VNAAMLISGLCDTVLFATDLPSCFKKCDQAGGCKNDDEISTPMSYSGDAGKTRN
jgi:hypothetical protein